MGKSYDKFTLPASLKQDHGFEHLENVGSGPATGAVTREVKMKTPQATQKLSRKQKFQKHVKRYWICYGIAGIIFLAIFLPLL
jgi:hypothetical protein